MKDFLYWIVYRLADIHTWIMQLNDGFEQSFTDKELHPPLQSAFKSTPKFLPECPQWGAWLHPGSIPRFSSPGSRRRIGQQLDFC